MQKLTDQDPETQSADLVADNLAQLKALFPEAFTEGKVDFEVLKQLLGGAVEDREEKYGLNWHGKRRARQMALTPSTGTLRPCPEESMDWDTTQNLMIEGDNLEVLKLLQKSYAGKVKLIYIDPPYNTGRDFVYPDNFQDNIKNYLELTGQIEGGKKISSNTESSGRFHTDWLNMMYPRLKLARNLLSNFGWIAVSVDDREVSRLRAALDEIFGEENFIANIVWQKKYTRANDAQYFSANHDHILVFAKSRESANLGRVERGESQISAYGNPDNHPKGVWKATPLHARSGSNTGAYTFSNGIRWNPPTGTYRRYSDQTMKDLEQDNAIWFGSDGKQVPQRKSFLEEMEEGMVPVTIWDHKFAGNNHDASNELKSLDMGGVFTSPKPTLLIRREMELFAGVNNSDVILDFFSGSGTTGHAVMAQNSTDNGNRRFILVQLPEPLNPEKKEQKTAAEFCDQLGKPRTIAELTKERLRRAAAKIKADPQMAQRDTDNGKPQTDDLFENPLRTSASSADKPTLDLGFRVFKLDSSNIHAWDPNRDNLADTLIQHAEHLKTDRTEQDILFELLLKLGLDLTVPIETKTIHPQINTDKSQENHLRTSAPSADKTFTVHSIGSGVLLTCLAPQISNDEVESLALGIVDWHQQLAPAGETQVVFRDSAFADDVGKTNLSAILQQNGLENVRSL